MQNFTQRKSCIHLNRIRRTAFQDRRAGIRRWMLFNTTRQQSSAPGRRSVKEGLFAAPSNLRSLQKRSIGTGLSDAQPPGGARSILLTSDVGRVTF